MGKSLDLTDLVDTIESLARIPSVASKEVADEIRVLLEEQFSRGEDPYGNRWKPLASGERSHLYKTGDLLNSIEVKPMAGAGVQVTIGAAYGIFHQVGTRFMPKRAILPDGPALPEAWQEAIARALDNAVARQMSRAKVRRR